METLKTFAISTCAVLVIASLTSMIVPNISQKNVIRILISTFILSGILYSIFDFVSNNNYSINSAFFTEVNGSEYEQIEYPDKILNSLEECTVNAVYPMIKDELKKYGVEQFGVTVSLESQKNGVSIKCVNITVHEPHINNIGDISIAIKNQIGLDVNLNVIKSEG